MYRLRQSTGVVSIPSVILIGLPQSLFEVVQGRHDGRGVEERAEGVGIQFCVFDGHVVVLEPKNDFQVPSNIIDSALDFITCLFKIHLFNGVF